MAKLSSQISQVSDSVLSLAGRWQLARDPADVGKADAWTPRDFADTIDLPTTTDVAGKGPEQPLTQNTDSLTRRHPFEGQAWYRRTFDVPVDWIGRDVALSVERTKHLTVYIDEGAPIDSGIGLSASHYVPLGMLSPGKHAITMCVDNSPSNWPERVLASHMLENSTQTNWNGMLGRIELQAEDRFGIRGIRTTAVGHDPWKLQVKAYLDRSPEGVCIHAGLNQTGDLIGESSSEGDMTVIAVSDKAKLWDEFNPNLCWLDVEVEGRGFRAAWSGPVGLRDFRSHEGAFLINGRRAFLRGKHDACVFPLTGHPPMDIAGWEQYFRTVQSYGLNHVRFHSWCPPDAAFTAADRLGMYLQPELPFWGDPSDAGVEPFLIQEGEAILREYGHHPSFVMLGLGNELWGSSAPRYRTVDALRAMDSSRLYSQGSNSSYWEPQEYEGTDYTVTAFTHMGPGGKLRGSYALDNEDVAGYIQVHTAGTKHTYEDATAGLRLPAVSHEVGQYQVFPNFAEAAKYTGALRADGLAVLRERVAAAGLLDQVEDFRRASGHLALQCYREEIEAALRTPKMGGFELLDLQDFPGQGTALVGMLDAFMDTKGLITPNEWRAFCSDLVPLALFPKFNWRNDETFTAEIRVANYGPASVRDGVTWELRQSGRLLARHTEAAVDVPTGHVVPAGSIFFPLQSLSAPARLELSVTVHDRASSWTIWVYPDVTRRKGESPVIARRLDTAVLSRLAEGKPILLIPRAEDLKNSLPGCFPPDFWCYQMFGKGNPPGTMGLLVQNDHPALSGFPTRFYSEWQWQDLVRHSRAVILDGLSGYRPIVQPIDNVFRNHRLGSLFEFHVGPGRLLVCAFDLLKMADAPEAVHLLDSLVDYVASDRFRPTTEIRAEYLIKLLSGDNGHP